MDLSTFLTLLGLDLLLLIDMEVRFRTTRSLVRADWKFFDKRIRELEEKASPSRWEEMQVLAKDTPPRYQSQGAAGFDLITDEASIGAHQTAVLDTGLKIAIPEGYFGLVRPRGSASKMGLVIQGVVDSDYRGEVKVLITNTNNHPVLLAKKAYAQMIICPYMHVAIWEEKDLSLPPTERGEGRFGSTDSDNKEKS